MRKLIITLILALFFISACSVQDPIEPIVEEPKEPTIDNSTFEDDIIKYEEGILEYKIKITKPTPCHTINKEELVMESYPVQVAIDLNIENYSPNIGCIQVLEEEVIEGIMDIGHKPGSFIIKLNNEIIYSTNLKNE
tara:strand:- start:40 stop:450 length:411 start_codon:yes stop_codon:yes gene_type:complete